MRILVQMCFLYFLFISYEVANDLIFPLKYWISSIFIKTFNRRNCHSKSQTNTLTDISLIREFILFGLKLAFILIYHSLPHPTLLEPYFLYPGNVGLVVSWPTLPLQALSGTSGPRAVKYKSFITFLCQVLFTVNSPIHFKTYVLLPVQIYILINNTLLFLYACEHFCCH